MGDGAWRWVERTLDFRRVVVYVVVWSFAEIAWTASSPRGKSKKLTSCACRLAPCTILMAS